jgi:LruC domain-containing protein
MRVALLLFSFLISLPAGAELRETRVATEFQVYVPPNNDLGNRYSAVVVTALAGSADRPNRVVLDDLNNDGDVDDTMDVSGLTLGQSVVRYIKDGAINDDMGGVWDGDFFHIDSDQPVSVYLVTDSDWQHDWAPAVNGTLRGTRFFLYANRTSVTARDINAFAYEDGTRIELYDLTDTPLTSSGVTALLPRPLNPIFSVDVDEGEDLLSVAQVGADVLVAGHTYEVIATRPITVLYGALANLNGGGGIRDGGGFVPGDDGTAFDDRFYFSIPHDPGRESEQELRIIAADANTSFTLEGRNLTTGLFEPIESQVLPAGGHADIVGGSHEVYRLTSTGGKVALFEANWLETGRTGTSDVASFAPGHFLPSGEERFLVYMGPPGIETNTVYGDTLSHLYLYSRNPMSGIQVVDADTNGTIFSQTLNIPAGGFADVALSQSAYDQLNRPAEGIRPYLKVLAPGPLSVAMANWNDNWMAYASSVLIRNPEVTVQGPASVTVDEPALFQGVVSNEGTETLQSVEVRVVAPANSVVLDASLEGSTGYSLTSVGSQTAVDFGPVTIAPGASLNYQVSLQPASGQSGEVLAVDVVVEADDGQNTVASGSSASTLLERSDVATVTGFSGSPGDGQVELSWQADGAASNMEVQRASSPSGPFASLPQGSLNHPASTGPVAYTFVDTSATNGTTFYYRLAVFGQSGASATAGPIAATPGDATPPPPPTLEVTAGDGQVDLRPSLSGVPDEVGVFMERRATGSSQWIRLNTVPTSAVLFSDDTVTNGVAYAYRAVAVDDDGNQSSPSATLWATPQSDGVRVTEEVIAYEDMLGQGQNDWDYNDFVVRVQTRESFDSNGNLTRLEVDYEPLARGAGYVHAFLHRFSVRGGWTARLRHFDAVDPTWVVLDEVYVGDGTAEVTVYADTRDALPSVLGSYANTDSGQSTYAAGLSARLEIFLDVPEDNADGSYGTSPFDPFLYLPYLPPPGEIHLADRGGAVELNQLTGPLEDVYLDFALRFQGTGPAWPFEGEPIWRVFPEFDDEQMAPSEQTRSWNDRPVSLGRVFHKNRGNQGN